MRLVPAPLAPRFIVRSPRPYLAARVPERRKRISGESAGPRPVSASTAGG